MAPHVTHIGVHDHGFNNVSTYGNLLRLMNEGRIPENAWERRFYELALKCSGAVQAARWSAIADGGGYIYSFNGPHSLFVDTIRSLRALAVSHRLGHVLMGENDRRISLLDRLIQHAQATARYSVYYGEGRDIYDVRGPHRAREHLQYRTTATTAAPIRSRAIRRSAPGRAAWPGPCAASPNNWSFLATLPDDDAAPYRRPRRDRSTMRRAAEATCDFYIETLADRRHSLLGHRRARTCTSWATGRSRRPSRSTPTSRWIVPPPRSPRRDCCGSGRYLNNDRYWQAGLTVCDTLFAEPYLSTDPNHQGLILHAVYHRPNGWDHAPAADGVPAAKPACGAIIMPANSRSTCCA